MASTYGTTEKDRTQTRTGTDGRTGLDGRTEHGLRASSVATETPRSGVTTTDRVPERRDETKTARPRRGDGDDNPDPITGTPGSHPVGTGVGAAGGGAAGAAVGAVVGGPVGALVGGAVGAIAGGAAGHGVAERIDPTVEDTYWRDSWRHRDYTKSDSFNYDEDYRPAYRYGWESRERHAGRTWDDGLETELSSGWEKARGTSRLKWEEARDATRDAWHRVENRLPGDADRDGR